LFDARAALLGGALREWMAKKPSIKLTSQRSRRP
jgi:hypothetical protein